VTTIVVTAAIVEREGCYLVTQRQTGTHLAGLWEFPGGKCVTGETLQTCLARELREELGVDAEVGPEVFTVTHAYEDRRVELHFLRCSLRGVAVPQQGQAMQWVARTALGSLDFPPADRELIRMLSA